MNKVYVTISVADLVRVIDEAFFAGGKITAKAVRLYDQDDAMTKFLAKSQIETQNKIINRLMGAR